MIRALVYDCLAEGLGYSELKIACSMGEIKLIQSIFKAVNDPETCVSAMQAMLKITEWMRLSGGNSAENKAQLKVLEKAQNDAQLSLLTLAVPTPENTEKKTA